MFATNGSPTFAIAGNPTAQSKWGCNTPATTTNTCWVQLTGIAADGSMAANAVSIATSYVRFYTRFASGGAFPSSLYEPWFDVVDTAGSMKLRLCIDTSQVIKAFNSGGTLIATGATVFSTATWYRIEVKCGTGLMAAWEVKINGVSEISGATDNLGAFNAGSLKFGKTANLNGKGISYAYDDVLWSDSAYPGAGGGVLLIPTGDGHYINGTANGAANKWQCLLEVPSDGDTTYVDSLILNNAYTATCAASGIGSGTINNVTGIVLARNLGAGGGNKTRVRSNASDSDTAVASATASYLAYCRVLDLDPNTGAAWTSAGVDAAEVGFVEGVAGMRFTGAYLSVDYVPGVAPAQGAAFLFGHM